MPHEDLPNAANAPNISIEQLAERVPAFKNEDDFTLPPLVPTVEDALVLPRQTDATTCDIAPPDALPFLNPSSSTT